MQPTLVLPVKQTMTTTGRSVDTGSVGGSAAAPSSVSRCVHCKAEEPHDERDDV